MSERSFHRVRFNTDVAIVGGGGCFHGRLENISLGGIFIRAKQQVSIGETDDITLPIPTVSMPSGIKFKGTVVRIEESGIAYRISTIDYDTITHLKSILKNKIIMQLAACLMIPYLLAGLGGFDFLMRRNGK